MTYEACRREAVRLLSAAGVTEGGFDALLLLEKAGGPDRNRFELLRREEMPEELRTAFEALIQKRAKRIPLQHLLGEAWFMGLPFTVSPEVLIPRPDTETLCEAVLAGVPGKGKGLTLLDLCTGSGCIGISLGVLGAFGEITLADISAKALQVAEKNVQRNGVAKLVRFAEGDLLEARLRGSGRPIAEDRFDVICCNPPYIAREEIETLMPEVKDHDPRLALDGGTDGLDFYRRLSFGLDRVLAPGGFIFLEIGEDQGKTVPELFRDRYGDVKVLKDLAGLNRVVVARKKP